MRIRAPIIRSTFCSAVIPGCALVFTLLLIPSRVAAQTSADTVAALNAAIDHVRTEVLPEGGFSLHPEYMVLDPPDRPMTLSPVPVPVAVPGDLRTAVEAIAWTRMDQAVSCEGRLPRSCRVEAGVSVIGLTAPRFTSSSTARVGVKMTYPSGRERRPVAIQTVILELCRIDGEWRVADSIGIQIT